MAFEWCLGAAAIAGVAAVERRVPNARFSKLAAAFKAAAGRAKLPAKLVQHDLRHTRITRWLADGKNPVHVKEAVGHADLRMTMAYTHLVRENLRGLVDEPDREALRELA